MCKRFLVTGGGGFLGRSLVAELIKRGNFVRTLDNYSRGHIEMDESLDPPLIDKVVGDICDPDVCMNAVKGMDAVVHMAAINGTEFFYEKPEVVLEVATKGMLNTLDACIANGVREIFTASSSEVYHRAENIPTSETEALVVPDPFNARYSYSGGKIISELLTINYGKKHFDRAIIFRPHNVFGPNMGNQHVIPQFVKRMTDESLSKETGPFDFKIQGTGEETRAFVYVDDFTKGLMTVIDRGEHLNIYHIGSEQEISVKDLAEKVAEALGLSVNIVPGVIQEGSPLRRCPDISKLKSLGYNSEEFFNEGFAKTVKWYS